MPNLRKENVTRSSISVVRGMLKQTGFTKRLGVATSPVAGWQADETKPSPCALRPVKRLAKPMAGDAEAVAAWNHESTSACPPLRILLAEDSKINQIIGVKMLEQLGHTVVAVDNGRLALEAIERESFDLVFMDVQMPEMTGFEAVAAIRERERSTGAHIPIIALTASTEQGDEQQCLEEGMDSYLSKPVCKQEMLRCIADLMPGQLSGQSQVSFSDRPPTGDLLDHSALLDSVNGNKMLLQAIVRLFMKKCEDMVSKIGFAVLSNDASSLESAAHTLKGSSNLMTGAAAGALKRLERMGREGDLQDAQNELSILRMEIARAESELFAILSENGE